MSIPKALTMTIPAALLIVVAVVFLGMKDNGLSITAGTKSESSSAQAPSYDFTTVARGAIESVVSSSGTLEPLSTVNVLARMSGRAVKVHADYNDMVKKGQILVSLDTAMLELQRKESEASVRKARASHELAQLDSKNKETLAAKGLIAEYELVSARTSLSVAAAELAQAEAGLEVIDTQLTSYALVRSPIDGIVLERNVDVGQSVVEGSSSNSSSLFTLAEDLSRMLIEAEVDELDIGSIKVAQAVVFAVEAVPGREFSGSVKQIRLVPATVDNVVTYTVIVEAENAEALLLPGMTATVEFQKENKQNVLVVPNAALRFSPTSLTDGVKARKLFAAGLAGLAAEEKAAALSRFDEAAKVRSSDSAPSQGSGGLAGMMMPAPGGAGGPGGPPGSGERRSGTASGASATKTGAPDAGGAAGASARQAARKALWYLDSSGELQAILVEAGSTDGSKTEVSGAEELEGMRIILKVRI